MPPNNSDPENKQEIQQQTIQAINQRERGMTLGSLPLRLPALIALVPATILGRLVYVHISHIAGIATGVIIFLSLQILLGLYFRSFLRKHPDLKWQILIR